LKVELKAVAQLANMDLKTAAATTRKHPLWEEEIHIEEELINLQEAFETHAAADESLTQYPQMRRYLVREQRNILKHCIGLIARMQKGRRLPREYDEKDTEYALTKLIRLLVAEAVRVDRKIDDEILEILKPFLSLRQRLHFKEWKSLSPRLYARLVWYRVGSMLQFDRA
jgi:hypothetical protein